MMKTPLRGRIVRLALTLLLLACPLGGAHGAGGDLLWERRAPLAGKQEGKAFALDSQGCAIVAGYAEAGGGTTDYRTVKFTADGAGVAWGVTFDYGGGSDAITAVAVDASDNVIVTGYVWAGTNFDIHTIKYSGADGHILWQSTFKGAAGGSDFGTALAVDSINNVYVGGYIQGASAKDDMIVLKYGPDGPNPDGTPIWKAIFDGGGHDRVAAIAAGASRVAVTGESQNATPDFDSLTLLFDDLGNLLWQQRRSDVGDGKGQDVLVDGSGDVVVTGYTAAGGRAAFTAKYPKGGGSPLWTALFNDSFDDEGKALRVDAAGDVYVTGSTFRLDSGSDVFTARYAGGSGAEVWRHVCNSDDGNNDLGIGIVLDGAGDVFVAAVANDAVSGFDNVHTLKYRRETGVLLWKVNYDGAGKADRPAGIGIAPAGEVLVGGWSDRWTAGASDYDFLVLAYDPGRLNNPTGLLAQTVSNTEIRLTWVDNAATEDSYVVERKIGSFGTWGTVATLSADTVGYNDAGLTPDTRYFYRVKAFSAAAGSSPWSNEADARTTLISFTPPAWLYTYGGPDGGDDHAAAVAVGPDGHPVVTGHAYSLAGGFDYLTIKLDRGVTGKALWSARFNDEDNESDFATALTVDSSNRVVVSGFASLYGGGAGNTNDIYTISYPAAGPPATWEDQYNGPAGDDDRSAAVAAAIDGTDSTVVIGYGKNTSWNDDIYVIKYDKDGLRKWAASPYDGGGEDHPAAVASDGRGDIFVAGHSVRNGFRDFFVAKYHGGTGQMGWGGAPDLYDGPGAKTDYAVALAVDPAGDLYVVGYSVNLAGNGDIRLIKYSGGTGVRLWQRVFDGGGYDMPAGVVVDAVNADVIVAGTTFVGPGNHDIVVLRYSAAGDPVWTRTLERSESDDGATGMAIDRSGIVTVAGSTATGGNENALAVKFDDRGTIVGATVYDGEAAGVDSATAVTVNRFGEAFVAGFTTNSSGSTDYLVLKAHGESMQTPHPLTAVQLYTRVDLSWTDNSLNEDGFRIERKPGSCGSSAPWTPVHTAAAGVVAWTDTGLSVGSTFCYRAQSFRTNGESSRWTELEVTTADPLAPGGLGATVLSTTELRLNWVDTTSGESGFTVERCEGIGCSFTSPATFSVPANATTWTDAGVCAGQVYSYRLRAYRSGEWTTDSSNTAADVVIPSPLPPANFAASWTGEERIDLRWTDGNSDETEFLVERCTGVACSDFAQVGVVPSPSGNVLLLRMDEGSWNGTAGEVRDASGQGRHGTANGGVTTTAGRFEMAGSFDGVNDFVTTPLVINQANGTAGATFAAWVRPSSTTAGTRYVMSTDNSDDDWGILRSGGTWQVATGEGIRSTGAAVTAGQWQHIAAVFIPGTGVKFYRNGVESTIAFLGYDASSANLTVGRRGSMNQEFFDGLIDEVAVFDRPLTAAQIQAIHQHGVSRYTDTTVAHSTNYAYRVRARKGADCPWTSGPAPLLQLSSMPPPPGNVTATAGDSTRVFVTWTDNTSSESGFAVERCAGAGCTDFAPLGTTAANVTFWVDSSVCAGTTYRYQVKAVRSGFWTSAPGSPSAATTPPPPTPSALAVTETSEERIALAWALDSTDLSGFRVRRCTGDATFCASDLNYVQAAEITGRPSDNALYLPFDEFSWTGAAGEVADRSGAGRHGTAYGGVSTTGAGRYLRGGEFDGVDDYIATPLNINQTSGGPGMTFEAWVYPTVNSSSYKYVFSTENGGNDWGFVLYGGTWYVVNGASIVATTLAADFNAWQHMTVVFRPGTGISLYKNGNQGLWTSAAIDYDTSSNNLAIGRQANSSNYFAGRIDEILVYTRPLSAAEVLDRFQKRSTFADPGLASGTTYTYRVSSYKGSSCPWESAYESRSATTLSPPPPTAFSATAVGTTQVNLAWTDNTTSETGFRVERCLGAGSACDEDAEFSLLASLAPNAASYTDAAVCNGGSYTYRVRAEKGDGPVWQTAWALASASTAVAVPPSGFTANGISESEVVLAWTDTTPDEERFVLQRCTGSGGGCDEDSEFTVTLNTIPGTALGNVLHYRMDEVSWNGTVGEVKDASGFARHGRSFGGMTTIAEGRPGRAGLFDASNDYITTPLTVNQTASGGGATFQAWVYPTIGGNNYRFVISTDDGGNDWGIYHYGGIWYVATGENWRSTGVAVDLNTWQHIAAVFIPGTGVRFYKNGVQTAVNFIGYNSTSATLTLGRYATGNYYYFGGRMDEVAVYDRPLTATEIQNHYQHGIQVFAHRDVGLSPGTAYTYRVRAEKGGLCGWSVDALASTSTMAPPAPSALAATVSNTTRIALTWTDNSGSETAFRLERCTGAGSACDEDGEFALRETLPANAISYSDDSVCSATLYSYRVRAEKSDAPVWQTAWNGPVSATTPAPSAPSALSATRISEVEIALSWADSTSDESGFRVERCAGVGCSDFSEVATVDANVTNWSDPHLVPGGSYSYRVRSYKSAACGWTSPYSAVSSAVTSVADPSGLAAVATNTTRIDLTWNDNAATETGTVIERCAGAACSSFAPVGIAVPGVSTYSDQTVAHSTTYRYRIMAENKGLSRDGGGCWTRRQPLVFGSFVPEVRYRMTVAYDADMRPDFGDLRFYDTVGRRELSYQIESKVDGVSASVSFMAGKNSAVYLYYGNPAATDSSRDLGATYTFPGTTISTAQWVEIDPNNSIAQNNGLILNDVSDTWDKALISTSTFPRGIGGEIYASIDILADTPGNNHFMVGWGGNQTSNPHFNQLVHALYWNNYLFTTFEKGVDTGSTGTQPYSASTRYEMRIILKANGARYLVRGGAYNDWTVIRETSTHGDTPLRIGIAQYSHAARINQISITLGGVTAGPEEADGCYAYSNLWTSGYSGTAQAATATPVAPSALSVTAVADTLVQLAWADNTADETGFRIERCAGSGCSNFAETATAGANVSSYNDSAVAPSTPYRYRVRAYKDAVQPWQTAYSSPAGDMTFPGAASGLSAVPLNSRMIRLQWTDNASDEEGFEIEVQAWNGRWALVATVGSDVTGYTDTVAIEPARQYRYRVRPYRGTPPSRVYSPYSNEGTATTPAWKMGDGTCP